VKGSRYAVEESKVYEFCVVQRVFYLMAVFFVPFIGLHVYGLSYVCHMWGVSSIFYFGVLVPCV